MNLLVYLFRVRHRAGNFLTQKFGVPFAQTMNQRLHSSNAHVEPLCDFLVGRQFLTASRTEKWFKCLENRWFSLSTVLLPQAPEGLVQKSHCPTGIENFLSGQSLVSFRPIAFVTTFEVERNKLYVPSSF